MGKGSAPRNIFSRNWRNNFGDIDWTETFYAVNDGTMLLDHAGNRFPVKKGTAIKIKGGIVYTFSESDSSKIIELNLTPASIRSSNQFTKTPIQNE